MSSHASEFLDTRNPAASESMVRAPLSPLDEVNESLKLARWQRLPGELQRPGEVEHEQRG